MSILTKEQENKFVTDVLRRSIAEVGNIDKITFYDMFWDFVTDEEIEGEYEALESEERRLFRYCHDRGYLSIAVEQTLENTEKIENYFNKLKQKYPFIFFHFSFYFEDEDNMSLNEIYKKWNEKCPKGWFATYCTCGSFTPKTPELATVSNMWIDGYDIDEEYHPIQLHIEMIEKVEIYSNNYLRFYLEDDIICNCKVYAEIKTANLLELCT